MLNLSLRTGFSLGLLVFLASAATAQQQSSAGRELVLEEVLVTANKREQNLQEIATTVSVIGANMLDDNSVTDFKDIESLTAGVNLESYGLDPGIAIRGVGRQGGPDSAVVVTVDGNLQIGPAPVFGTMLDIQQVEIIRGPQGTLYGKNAPVGAFNITTVRPDFDGVHGNIETTFDNFDTKLVRSAVNVPLVDDKFAMRVSALYEDTDGFIDFKGPNGADVGADNNGGNASAGRIRLLGFLTDKLTMNLTMNYSSDDKGYTEGVSNDADHYDYELNTEKDNFIETQNEAAVLRLDYDREDYVITLVTAYQEYSRDISRDADGSAAATSGAFDISTPKARSRNVELRFVSSNDSAWEYLGGLFYAIEDSFAHVDVANGVAVIDASRLSESFGAFANNTYRFNKEFAVTAGLRYSDDRKRLVDQTVTALGTEGLDGRESFYNTSGSLKFQYSPNDRHNYYLALDSAFRAGDFNPFMTKDFVDAGFRTLDQEDSNAIELGFKGDLFDGRVRMNAAIYYQEYRDIQVVNAAGAPVGSRIVGPSFVCGFVPGGVDNGSGSCVISQNQGFPQNVAKAVSQGAEVEFATVLTEQWSLEGAVSYNDIRMKDANGLACKSATNSNPGETAGKDYDPNFPPKVDGVDAPICNLGEARLPGEPHWSTSLQSSYEDIAQIKDHELEYYGRGLIKHDGERGSRGLGERTTLEFTVGLAERSASGWDVSLWVKNALDKEYARFYGGSLVGVGEPRRYGLTLRKSFN